MKMKKWLTVNSRGSARITEKKPSLETNEIAVLLTLQVPDALFTKPHLEAEITIPNEAAVTKMMSAETVNNVEECVKSVLGLDLKVSIVPVKDEEKP